jgi:hypothetical protein
MSLKTLFLSTVFSTFFFGYSTAQTSVELTPSNSILNNWSSELPEITDENWTFFLDEENRIYYIDFETINVNLNDIQVKNKKGEIVLKDNLWDLPVNTIYELDFKNFETGTYEIELRTYTGVLRRTIEVD